MPKQANQMAELATIRTDEELVAAASAGDQSAFAELVRRYEPRVAATVIGMLGRGPEAEDVGQEVFVRLYHALARFHGRSGLGTYLTRIAINESINELRRRRRRNRLFASVAEEQTFDEKAPDNRLPFEDRELIQRAISRLKPEFRAVLVLRLIDGYSTEETAEILEIPVGTVLSRLARAQKKLRTILAPYYGGD